MGKCENKLPYNYPLISVIVPVYNVERYLKECVDSIVTQTYKNLEIILVDDGSSDSCPAICDSYTAKDSRIKVIHQSNAGLSQARNSGIKASTGNFLIFIDSDDIFRGIDVIQNVVDFLNKTGAVVTYCCNNTRVGKDGVVQKLKELPANCSLLTPNRLFDIVVKRQNFFAAWTFIVQREFVIEHSLFFTKDLIFEDIDWIPRLFESEPDLKIHVFTKPYYVYRYNPSSITNTINQHHFESMKSIILNLKARLSSGTYAPYIKKWFNINLNSLFSLCYPDRSPNPAFYQKNFKTVKHLYITNYHFLNFKNNIIFLFIIISPQLFFAIRKIRNSVKGL